MIVRVSRKTPKRKIKAALSKISTKKKKINLDKFFGKVNFGVDGLTYQRNVRENE